MKPSISWAGAAALALLGACNNSEDANNMGVTAEEAAALNDAENMLDASPDSLTAPDDVLLGNGEVSMDGPGEAEDAPAVDIIAANTQ